MPGLSKGSVCQVSSSPQNPEEGAACMGGGGTGSSERTAAGASDGHPGSAPSKLPPPAARPRHAACSWGFFLF